MTSATVPLRVRPGEPALLEREAELALLAEAWAHAAAGRGSAFLIAAEGGAGKTRLLRAAAAERRTAEVLWGAADPVGPPEPYLALTRALPGFAAEGSRSASAERASRALEAHAAGRPVLVVLEDLHFADSGTLAAAARLASECRTRKWVLAFSFRPDEGTEELQRAAAELAAQGLARRIDVPPLSVAAVAELAGAIRGEPLPAREAEALHAESGGNPWFAESLVRGSGALTAARDRLQLRLGGLERALPGSYGVLTALAPATSPLASRAVGALCGGDSRELRRLLTSLRDAAILSERDEGWIFRQDLMRQVVLASMISADRRDAHRSLAEVLEGAGGRAPELAMHYAAANDARAGAWAWRAALEAQRVQAHAEAYAQLQRLLCLELGPAERQLALAHAVGAALRLGRDADAHRLAEEATRVSGGDARARAGAHYVAALAAAWAGEGPAATAELRQAAAAAAEVPNPGALATAILCLELVLAALECDALRLAAAAEHATLAAGEVAPDEQTMLAAYVAACTAMAGIDLGAPDGGERLAAMLATVAGLVEPVVPGGLPGMGLLAGWAWGKALLAGDAGSAAAAAREMEAPEGWESGGGGGMTLALRGLDHVLRAEWSEGAAALRAREQAGDVEHGSALAMLGRVVGEVRGGRMAAARAAFRPLEGDRGAVWNLVGALAELELAVELPASEARAVAERAYATAEPLRAGGTAGRAAVAIARAGAAPPAMPEWLAAESRHALLWRWAEALRGEDRTGLAAVAAALAERSLPFEAALALRDAGELSGAYRAFRGLEATLAREETAAMLRAANLPIPRRSAAAVAKDGLTETEREVCRLLASGARNDRIASALTVSVRTVETHLSHLYQKAGCQGRVALATWWREYGGKGDG